jgi:hypothetical protein
MGPRPDGRLVMHKGCAAGPTVPLAARSVRTSGMTACCAARMTFSRSLAGAAVTVALSWHGGYAAPAACPMIDAFGDFLAISDRLGDAGPEAQASAFDHDFARRYAALYGPTAVGLSGPKLDELALPALRVARTDALQRRRHDTLLSSVPQMSARFANTFPDFRCDFPIYLAPTFGRMDGAGRQVAGRPSLILGVDTIARFETDEQLPVFLAHEMFHRYHFAVAGFSDDLADRDVIWRTLWAEGLATYVSARLNPDRPLADALLLPRDLEARATPLVPVLARELLPNLDRTDSRVFGRYFLYGDAEAERLGRPPRSGYYLGYLVAQRLGAHRSLAQLAHLKGPRLRREIGAALVALGSPA